jgi:crotonobetaine/carnitine-CoA ligase
MYLTDAGAIAEQFQFRNENIGSLLKGWVDEHPDKVFIYWHPFSGEGRTWTYQQFWYDINALAGGLQQHGINVGDKVILHCENCPEILMTWYACSLIGAVAVTTNTGATATEMEHFISTTGPVALITQPRFLDMLSRFEDRFSWMVCTATNSDTSVGDMGDYPRYEPFAQLYDRTGSVVLADCSALTPAGILFTSGTTGLPKAVVHTHGNLLWSATMGPHNIDMRPEDVMLTYLPFFHVNAQMWSTAIALGVGASVVLLPKVTVSRFWPIVQKYGVTHMSMLPLVFNVATQNIPEQHSLKRIGMAELPAVSKMWKARFHSIFGSSETIIHALCSSPHRQYPERSLGSTVPGYQCQVINPETMNVSQPGETGELWVKGGRGIQMFLEYYNDPEATEAAFVDGWFRTGDGIKLGENGHMYFTQRLKDMIKVGGENVGVEEVEAVIMQMPEVGEVAVVAKKHPDLDEVPVAYVIAAGGTETQGLDDKILDHCREHMSMFKIPRYVCVVDDFPRVLLNKIAKNKLREMAEKL